MTDHLEVVVEIVESLVRQRDGLVELLEHWQARAEAAEAAVARVEEQIDLLGMDRVNWQAADRLRDVLEGR